MSKAGVPFGSIDELAWPLEAPDILELALSEWHMTEEEVYAADPSFIAERLRSFARREMYKANLIAIAVARVIGIGISADALSGTPSGRSSGTRPSARPRPSEPKRISATQFMKVLQGVDPL